MQSLFPYQGEDVSSFGDWLSQMFNQRTKEEHAEIVTMCWAI